MAALDPHGLSDELDQAFEQRRRDLSQRLQQLVKKQDAVLFAGALIPRERAEKRYREIRWSQSRALLEVIGLYLAISAGAFFLFKLVAAYCR